MKHTELAMEISKAEGKGTLKFGNHEIPVLINSLDVGRANPYSLQSRLELNCEVTGEMETEKKPYAIERVIFNNPATIVFWADGTKTVVKCSKDDTYSEEVGLAMAICKKVYGNEEGFNKVFKAYCPNYRKKAKRNPRPGPDVESLYPKLMFDIKARGNVLDAVIEKRIRDMLSGKLVGTNTILRQFLTTHPGYHIRDIKNYERSSAVRNGIIVKLVEGSEIMYKYDENLDNELYNEFVCQYPSMVKNVSRWEQTGPDVIKLLFKDDNIMYFKRVGGNK